MRVMCLSEENWLKERLNGITGSDAAVILGVSKWDTPMSLFAAKLGLSEPKEKTEAMSWGLRLEEPLAKAYADETGHAPVKTPPWCIDINDDRRWQKVSLDFDLTVDGEHGSLETKTTGAHMAKEWEDGVPSYYVAQVQHGMAVTGRTFAVVCVLIGGQKMLHARVDRDDKAISLLNEAEAEFWDRLLKNIPPPITPKEESAKVLAQIFNNPRNTDVALPVELVDVDARLVHVKEQIKSLEAERNELENRIRVSIGDHMAGLLPSGVRYTWKPFAKKEYMVKAQTGRMLRRVSNDDASE